MRIYIDIETQPTCDPNRITEIAASVQPPSNYTKQETRDNWFSEKGAQAIEEAVSKTALDATDGQIISIGFAEDDGDVTVICQHPGEYDEHLLIRRFIDAVEELRRDEAIPNATKDRPYTFPPYWVGHNVTFDLGFIWRRALIHGIALGELISGPGMAKSGKDYFCTMNQWAGPRDRISLDKLCKTLRIESPKESGVTGATAWRLWRAGEVELVKEYNARDVIATREIFQRMEALNHGH